MSRLLRICSAAAVAAGAVAVGVSPAGTRAPDEGTIAFYEKAGDNFDVFTADLATGEEKRLTTSPHDDFDPDWSPDGKRIAFVRCLLGSSYAKHCARESAYGVVVGKGAIFVMNADGTAAHRITPFSEATASPRWAPDGRQIVFQRVRPGQSPAIHVVGADGRNLRRLTSGESRDSDPDWSPDGRRIAFERGDAIWTMNANSTGARAVVQKSENHSPVWSPDGRRLVFHRNWGRYLYDLFAVLAAGGEATKLTRGSVDKLYPAFSSDGTQIAFQRGNSDYVEHGYVYVANADGSNQKRVVKGLRPAWRPS